MAKTKEKTKAELAREEAFKKLGEFTRKMGKDLDVTLSTEDFMLNRENRKGALPSGSLAVDLALGGGFPRHRLTVISGWESTGKTTLMQSVLANQLVSGGMGHYGDFEGASDPTWIKNGTGVDLTTYQGLRKGSTQTFYPLYDFQNGDDYFRYVSRMLDQTVELGLEDMPGLLHLFCLDSIPSLSPEDLMGKDSQGKYNDEKGDKPMIAAMMAKWLPMVRSRFKRANSAMIAINQLRLNPRAGKFENPEYEPGGNTPRFMADVRIRMDAFKVKTVGETPKDHPLLHEKVSTPKADGIVFEVNPDGTKDSYVYRKMTCKKNRVFPSGQHTYIRICTSKGGGEGTGIDKVFDTLRFFEELGRLTWSVQGGTAVVTLDGKDFPYFDIKREIETNSALRDEALEYIETAEVWNRYGDFRGGKLGKPDPEQESEAVKEIVGGEE